MKYLITTLAVLALPVSVFAHAADHTGASISHFFSSLFHVFPIAGITAILSYQIAKKIYSKK